MNGRGPEPGAGRYERIRLSIDDRIAQLTLDATSFFMEGGEEGSAFPDPGSRGAPSGGTAWPAGPTRGGRRR